MKGITLWQPWASLIAEGIKTIETRPKQHPWRSAIGQTIAIHAATKKPIYFDLAEKCWSALALATDQGDGFGTDLYLGTKSGDGEFAAPLPLGAVVATCTLVDVVPISDRWAQGELPPGIYARAIDDTLVQLHADAEIGATRHEGQLPFGDYTPGRWALLLDNIVKTAPAPCRGYQGLWTLPDVVADNLLTLAA